MTSATSQSPISQQPCDSADGTATQVLSNDAATVRDAQQTSPQDDPAAGNTAAHSSASPDYERLRALAALYDERQRSRSRPIFRTALMLLTFAVGTSAGLAATWWLAGARSAPASVALSRPLATVSASGDAQVATSARPGISASELPYDGRKTPSAQTATASVPRTNPEELPYAGQPVESKESPSQAETGNAKRANNAVRATRGNASVNAVPSERSDDKNETQTSARKSAKAYRSSSRVMKDREIDRIRQQADEELKKKSEHRRAVSEARNRSRSSSSQVAGREGRRRQTQDQPQMHARLAKCSRAGNIIRREQCKWRLCNGMWGKNGCPSYAHANPY